MTRGEPMSEGGGMALAPPKASDAGQILPPAENHTLAYRAPIGSPYLKYHDDLGELNHYPHRSRWLGLSALSSQPIYSPGVRR